MTLLRKWEFYQENNPQVKGLAIFSRNFPPVKITTLSLYSILILFLKLQ